MSARTASRPSLGTRLALLFSLLSFVVAAGVGAGVYRAMEMQLSLRDDSALLYRADLMRTILREADAMELARNKPHLFANMLGNQESLLVIGFPGQAPLVNINPGHAAIPDVAPATTSGPLGLDAVHHATMPDGTAFIAVSTFTNTPGSAQALQILSGRLLTERTRFLRNYRSGILLYASVAAFLTALLSSWITRRGLRPLRQLADQTAAIGILNLSERIDQHDTPSELLPLTEAFNAMLDRLEISFTQLSQVSADMAHDLRTPIGILMGQTEVALGQRRDPAYYEKVLGSNFEELQRLSKMTDNMLFLARAENADHAIERKALDVAEELQRVAEYFEGPAEERDVRLVSRGDGQVWADANLLRRALANLLANAVRYAEPGSEIAVSAQQDASGTTMLVENRGPTIEEHHLSRLFDRFYRADASRREASAASGLGLSIVRSIMMLHQGHCAASSVGGVTRFTLFFPTQSPA